jgi:uncharacterized protein
MAPSSCIELSAAEREQLLQIASRSLQHGLECAAPLRPALAQVPQALRANRGAFVTLIRQGNLRGCIGTLEAEEPLAWAVADAAYSAAFRDPRFVPLQPGELDHISIEISVLSTMERVPVSSRRDLLAALRPERDGLLLQEHTHRATFLPQVWRQLPDPDDFLNHLLTKAGLPVGYWSPRLTFFCYQSLSFSAASLTLSCST